MKKLDNYYVNRHSCFLLQYHLVLTTKYRYPVIVDELKTKLLEYAEKYFSEQDMNILSINTEKDHIHITFECSPTVQLSKFVNNFKSASSRQIRISFSEFLISYYNESYFWNESYFICTESDNSLSLIKTYIENQSLQS